MTRASSSNPEMERVVKAVLDWLRIRGKEMPDYNADWLVSLEVDADHSALLSRLLDGKEPLEHKPPLYMSYPWYSLITEGSEVLNARFCHHHKVNEGGLIEGHYWHLGQQIWWITDQDGDKFFLKHAYGWTAELTPDMAGIKYVKDGEWVDGEEPGHRLTITGWENPNE